jgi:HlyD family secretion protein
MRGIRRTANGEPLVSRKTRLLVLVAVGVAAAALVYALSRRGGERPGVILLSGNIEVTDADVSFKIAGRVEERLFDEGELVKAGDVVARLETGELTAEVGLRRAELQAAQAALDELEAGSRPEEIARAEAAAQEAQAYLDQLVAGPRPQEVAQAQAALERAKADLKNRQVEYDRYTKLHSQGAVTTEDFDKSRTAYEVAQAQVDEVQKRYELVKEGPRKEEIERARAALAQAKASYELVKNGPRLQTIEQARAHVEQARQSLTLAETQLGYATVRSPLTGVVLAKHIESGEYVAPGTPVVTVGDLVHVWVRAYINETDLGRVTVGQQARVTTDTYPGKVYEGRVSFIASQAEFTPKNVQTKAERVKLVYRIKVDIPNPKMELKPGMPADVEILLDAEK